MNLSSTAGHAAPEVLVVIAWHDALNSGDVGRLVDLSHPDVEVGGPRGAGHGAKLLREWVGRASIRLEPGRIFHEADTVVVEKKAQWRSPETGESNDARTVASFFVVSDGLVASVVRYPDVAEALRAADLDESHERGTSETLTTERGTRTWTRSKASTSNPAASSSSAYSPGRSSRWEPCAGSRPRRLRSSACA